MATHFPPAFEPTPYHFAEHVIENVAKQRGKIAWVRVDTVRERNIVVRWMRDHDLEVLDGGPIWYVIGAHPTTSSWLCIRFMEHVFKVCQIEDLTLVEAMGLRASDVRTYEQHAVAARLKFEKEWYS